MIELLKSDFRLLELYVTEAFFNANAEVLSSLPVQCQFATEEELTRAGSLKTNNAALAVVELPNQLLMHPSNNEFVLALDDVRDPGNLGTIIRIADWYGIKKVYCSEETTDVFAPKVVQACMGSLGRVEVFYCSLAGLFKNTGLPVYGALLEGRSVYDEAFSKPGFILVGNEANGISEALQSHITLPVTIPRSGGAESLNVAIATAVICDNMRRVRQL